MTDELDTLRPEVREAINRQDRQERCDEYCPVCEDRATIRAELLRLADECATLKAQSIHPRAQLLIMLGHANERAEKAEGELASLKARIAEAPEVRMSGLRILTDSEEDARSAMAAWCAGTKRVRLVVEK